MMDRLSNLPDVAIERILEGLPLIDRVRTSVLSSAWELRWAKLPCVAFARESYSTLCKGEYRRLVDNYLMAIHFIMRQHIGPLRDFTLYIPPTASHTEYCEGFHPIIKAVLLKGVERLHLFNSGSSRISWPSSIFSSSKLTHLKLMNCRFDWPHSFKGFPNLISLHLVNPGCESHMVAKFISSCLQLQTVILEDVRFAGEEVWLDVPQLLYLSIKGEFTRLYLEHNQKLVSLYINASFKYISLKDAPNLERLSVCQHECDERWEDPYYEEEEEDENPYDIMSNIFEGLSKLQRTMIGGHFFELLATGDVSFKTSRFNQLTSLSFNKLWLCSADEVQCMFDLIGSCPNLKELTITMEYLTTDLSTQTSFISEINNSCTFAFQHLVRVHIELLGTITEMKIIQLLLGCSPILEVMSIRLTGKSTVVPTGGDRKSRLLEKVIRYCRASAKAKVVFLKRTESLAEALAN